MIEMSKMYEYRDDQKKYYEIIVLFRYGESDRIDLDNIEYHHIQQFLKNLCVVLHDVKQMS